MIPRYDGLVPAIRGPASVCAVASANATPSSTTMRTAAATAVTRYVICPVETVGRENAHLNAAAEHERRLFAFLPSVDCATPPRELRVSSHYFEDSLDASVAGSDAESGEDLDEDEESHTTARRGNPREDSAHGSNSGSRKRRRARRREPMRLEYDGFLTLSATEATKCVRLVSTPASEYSHLTCVLLQLPTTWREQDIDEGEGHGRTACLSSSSTSKPLITSIPLRRPILQLWGERNTAAAGPNDGSLFSGSSAASISAAWGSDTPLRISTKDWKTMDAAEADLHKPTNWSDDDGGDVSDEGRGKSSKGADDTISARARKREREEATNVAVRSFLAGAKEALRQQGAVGTADGFAQPQPAVRRDNAAPVSARVETSAPVKAAAKRAAVTVPLSSDSSGSRVRPSVATPAVPPARVLTTNSAGPLPSSGAAPPDGSASLDSLACTVVAGMQSTEARRMATLMELQKRILKQLPEFAAMSQKIKSTATKQEAVAWFQTSQQALRVWLVEHGHTINSDGTVTFGDV
ncbi:conserved hypothetical protein [Leishmania infantum JPCM5]|uniref:Uncharacterized protein n=2 Tax=Leishmania infantum TaxID=5671 RepID=A4I857_LEIIN|nr:conserved hypothetical protein [Leishmania infantum JPCM5]CAC9526233.1 hypothetical_protein_-_conserved [Leishmania infantum]CAM70997.1 conserved hypothetical protein [Leishmania infantum JPCM5]SUZ44818.1 hypothetical_protein_-_conserved [Leishmania infantum]|eukprot:XP_001467926.1 conserved hypothetical protein [Leishmania infantum JPCM5]